MSFEKDIKAFKEKAIKKSTITLRASAFQIFKNIIVATPKDTGRLINNWYTNIGSMLLNETDETSQAGARSLSEASMETKKLKVGQDIYMTNNLPYAQKIEHGYSKQAPNGMIGITVLKWRALVDLKAKGLS